MPEPLTPMDAAERAWVLTLVDEDGWMPKGERTIAEESFDAGWNAALAHVAKEQIERVATPNCACGKPAIYGSRDVSGSEPGPTVWLCGEHLQEHVAAWQKREGGTDAADD